MKNYFNCLYPRLLKFVFMVFVLLQTACATNRQLTREDWESVARKKYSHIEKQKLLKAAEDVLKLADASDFTFGYSQNGFVGTRKWSIFAILAATIGTDYWNFDLTEQTNNEFLATLQISRQLSNIDGYSAGGSMGVITTPTMGSPAMETASYDLFWRRMDYMLGLTTTWTSCSDEENIMKTDKKIWGNLDFFCGITFANSLPDNLTDSEIERLFVNDYYKKWQYIHKHNPARWEERVKEEPGLWMHR